jgi:antitoxin CptB
MGWGALYNLLLRMGKPAHYGAVQRIGLRIRSPSGGQASVYERGEKLEQDLATRRRRAYYRAHHRGTQEMDLLLGRYAAAKLDHMSAAELDAFEILMDQPDPDLQRRLMAPQMDDWAFSDADEGTGGQSADLIKAIRAFHKVGTIRGHQD